MRVYNAAFLNVSMQSTCNKKASHTYYLKDRAYLSKVPWLVMVQINLRSDFN